MTFGLIFKCSSLSGYLPILNKFRPICLTFPQISHKWLIKNDCLSSRASFSYCNECSWKSNRYGRSISSFYVINNGARKLSTAPVSKESKGPVVIEQLENITLIGINRPEKRNCVNSATAAALLQAFQDFDKNDDSKVAVLHGIGGNFCAGYDLEELSSRPNDTAKNIREEVGPMGPSRYETSKPVIAAVAGYAVAGGLELALWCDLRIMEETAVMGVFCRRFGVPLLDGGTVRLPLVVGLGRALDLITTGRPVRAPEALQIGLATQVVPCGCALGKAVFVAEGLLRYPQEALRADRNSARQAFFFPSMTDALVSEHRLGLKALKEAQIGATQFMKGVGRGGSFQLTLDKND